MKTFPKRILWAGLLLVIGAISAGVPLAHAQATQATVADAWASIVCSWRGVAPATKPLQLRFVAASDSEVDQTRKAQVRDAVTARTVELVKGAKSQDEAVALIGNNLARIEAWAQAAIDEAGGNSRVSAALTRRHLPASLQSGDCLPAGIYDVLEVTIGAGEGHNWFTVLYPFLGGREAVTLQGGSIFSDGRRTSTEQVRGRSRLLCWLRGGCD